MDASDYFSIQNLVYKYCDHLDRGDLDAMAALFAEADVWLSGADQPFRSDAAGIAAMYRQWTHIFPDTGTPKTRHVTTNLIIEPDGEGRARTQSYIVVFQATEGFPLQPVIAGRYNDRFAKRDGVWRFAERRMETDLMGDLSRHLLQALVVR